MQVLMILYKSSLDIQRVEQLFRERMGKYQAVEGLLQKLYVHEPATGEVGGIYIFDNRESLNRFRGSNLEKNIRETYRVLETPVVRVLDVVQTLRATASDDLGEPVGGPRRDDERDERD